MLQKIFNCYDSLVVVTVSVLTNMNPLPVPLIKGQKRFTQCISSKNGHGKDIRQMACCSFWFSEVSMGMCVDRMAELIVGQTEEYVARQENSSIERYVYVECAQAGNETTGCSHKQQQDIKKSTNSVRSRYIFFLLFEFVQI